MRQISLLGGVLAVLLGLAGPVAGQGFGRNKVQYDTFDWRVLVTEHLEIHFYVEEEELARRAADYGEQACRDLERRLRHGLSKKIPLIVYGSHYHFRQNNITASLVGESTGGFTEVFRNRIALPYSGSEEDFRHVIHHELVHAYVFDKLYGGPIKSLFVLQYAFYIPLWFMEGIAEYYSNEWDSQSEMMLRDAAISGALPPFDRIHGGYFVYKSGWSAVGYLVDRYGDDVVPDILDSLNETRDLRRSIQDVTGAELGAISADWLKDVRRETWPTYAELDSPDAVGRLLTHHGPEQGGLNANGTISPDGTRVVFLSNRSGTSDLWLMNVDDTAPPRALVRGSRNGKFESLHPLRSSVGWSPDGRYVVAAAQKGARDALYVLDAATGRTAAELTPDLDALERPDWSPADARFVFTGMKSGQVDLWMMDADGSNLERLTDDLAREEAPRFSPDARQIVFSSDAAESTGKDLWVLSVGSRDARPLRVAPGDQWDPSWSTDGTEVIHVSDELGTRDVVSVTLGTGEVKRLTALVGGADSPSVARETGGLLFTAFHDGGWDLVLVESPDSLEPVTAPPVEWTGVPWEGHTPEAVVPDSAAADSAAADSAEVEMAQADPEPEDPYVTGYRPRFRSEWINGAFFFDGFGANAAISAAVSDILGNHRFQVGANVFRSVENSDAFLTYSYLPRRFDWSVGVFHVKDFLFDDRTTLGQPIGEEGDDALFSERRWGLLGSVSYPFHTFRRVGLELTAMEVERKILENDRPDVQSFRGRVLLPRVHHSFDNTLWGWTGPVQGSRWTVSFQHSVPLGGERLSFGTALGDVRRYWRFNSEYVVAIRGFAATSFGRDPQQFQIGGPNSVRGHPRQAFHGRTAAVFSTEFRYPFVDYVKLGWPFRAAFGGVRGDLFVDVGTAFDDARGFRAVGRRPGRKAGLEDLRMGFGVGARSRIAYLPLRVDLGWPTDMASVGSPVWHFSIAPEF